MSSLVITNRAAAVSIEFDAEQIAADLDAGIDLGDWFQDWELEEITNPLPDSWREYDESIADEVEMITCPHCNK